MPVLFIQTGMVEQNGGPAVMNEGGLTQNEKYMNLSLSIFFLSLHTQEFVLDGNLHVHITACGIAEHV